MDILLLNTAPEKINSNKNIAAEKQLYTKTAPYPADTFERASDKSSSINHNDYWEETPLKYLRYYAYGQYGAYELTDKLENSDSKIKFKNDILNHNNNEIVFDYQAIKDLDITNACITTDRKGVRGSSVFNKVNLKKLAGVRDAGIKQIIDLRAESNEEKCKYILGKAGLDYTLFPIYYAKTFNNEEIKNTLSRFPKFLSSMDKGNYYIGCNMGTNRTDVAIGLNYLFNPKEKIVPVFEADNTIKSLEMTRQIANTILRKQDGEYKYTDEEYIKSLGWKDLETFEETFKARNKALGKRNFN